MHEKYAYENYTFFRNRALHIDTVNEEDAQNLKQNLNSSDFIARLDHGRSKETNYVVKITGSSVDISSGSNDLEDIMAALNDMYRSSLITKDKRDDLVLQIYNSEDTPERRAKIKAEFIAGIKARRKQRQEEVSVGNGSQLLMPPKKNLSAAPAPTNGHHQNENGHTNILKPGGK